MCTCLCMFCKCDSCSVVRWCVCFVSNRSTASTPVYLWASGFFFFCCCCRSTEVISSGIKATICYWVIALCAGCPFIPLFISGFFFLFRFCAFQSWSVRRECYTIVRSGLKHDEQQNSQPWAHKRQQRGNIFRSFDCGAFLSTPSAALLFNHLCHPAPVSKCTLFPSHVTLNIFSVWIWPHLCAYLCAFPFHALVLHPAFPLSAAAQCFGSQSTRLAVWRVSGGSCPALIRAQLHVVAVVLFCTSVPRLM